MRIIAGQAKGLNLRSPAGCSTRPMDGRSRGALFNILLPRLAGARVLDLYAGSGSLGLEALSRGAQTCVFVEKDRAAARLIEENLERSRLTGGEVLATPCVLAVKTLAARGAGFDLLFFDPPFADGRTESGRAGLARELSPAVELLAPGGLAVWRLERGSWHPGELPAALAVVEERKYGRSVLVFLSASSAEEGA